MTGQDNEKQTLELEKVIELIKQHTYKKEQEEYNAGSIDINEGKTSN